MARIPFATEATFPDDLKYVWEKTTTGTTTNAMHLFLTMSNNPRMSLAASRFSREVWKHCGLSTPEREMCILQCAFLKKSTYEWHQHVRYGRAAGLDDARILAIQSWHDQPGFSARDRVLLRYVDETVAQGTPSDEAFADLQAELGNDGAVGVTALIAFYLMTAVILASLQIETEGPFVGWDLQGESGPAPAGS